MLTFFLSNVAPGDPARIILGPNAREDSVQLLRTEMGLDRPLVLQFGRFFAQTISGRWGDSWITHQPVLREIGDHIRPTLFLGLLASAYSIILTLALNAIAFSSPRLGRTFIRTLRLGIALPGFVMAVATALATIRLQAWLMGAGQGAEDSVLSFAAPAVAVALYPTCVMTALLRDRIQIIAGSSFFRAARATGFSKYALFVRVLLGNSWSTLLTAWVNQISLLVFSTIVVEYVFSFRGIGTLLLRSIQGKDLPVLSGIVLMNGLFFLVVRSLSDTREPQVA
jgi:glutathione transport system permease protein